MDAGCDDYANKPIDRKKLLTMVSEYAQIAARSDSNTCSL